MSFIPVMSTILNRVIPAYTAYQMLDKKGPNKLKDFAKQGIAAGYTANEVIGYLRDHFDSPEKKEETQYLKERTRSGMARPEERVRSQQLQQEESQKDILQKGAALGAGVAAAGGPTAIIDSLRGQAQPQGEEIVQEEVSGTGNPIRDIDPVLADTVEQAIQQQGNPLAAGQLVKTLGKFNSSIGQLEKGIGQLFPDIVMSIYGQQAPPSPDQVPTSGQADQALMGILSDLMEEFR